MTLEEYIKKAKEECIEAGITDADDCEETVKNPLILKHIELFGVEPNCIRSIQDVIMIGLLMVGINAYNVIMFFLFGITSNFQNLQQVDILVVCQAIHLLRLI